MSLDFSPTTHGPAPSPTPPEDRAARRAYWQQSSLLARHPLFVTSAAGRRRRKSLPRTRVGAGCQNTRIAGRSEEVFLDIPFHRRKFKRQFARRQKSDIT
jgi:hypothetical protein